MKRKIITWHGENRSLFYVVEYEEKYPLDYSILATFEDRTNAEDFLAARAA